MAINHVTLIYGKESGAEEQVAGQFDAQKIIRDCSGGHIIHPELIVEHFPTTSTDPSDPPFESRSYMWDPDYLRFVPSEPRRPLSKGYTTYNGRKFYRN